MLRKKLNNLFPIALISFVIICSCNPNESTKKDTDLKRDTLNNWLTVNITFQPKASNELRRDYLNEIKQFLTDYVSSFSDSVKRKTLTATINQSTKDSLRYVYEVTVHRQYALMDSITDPRCPPLPGPRTIELAELEIICAGLD